MIREFDAFNKWIEDGAEPLISHRMAYKGEDRQAILGPAGRQGSQSHPIRNSRSQKMESSVRGIQESKKPGPGRFTGRISSRQKKGQKGRWIFAILAPGAQVPYHFIKRVRPSSSP